MANKPFNTRIQLKHDTEAHWELATGFSPKAGELIIYDVDATHSSPRFKVGDGTTNVNELPFVVFDYSETDPTVPAWAKATTKPTYTAQEVGALPDSTVIPTKTSDLTNDSGFLTAHQDISGKADKSATVSNVAYDTTNKKITKTINGTTSDVVSAATLKTDMSLSNVENKSSATIRGEITSKNVTDALGFTPTSNTGTVTSVATGVGLTGGTITGSGTIKAKLKSETALTNDSTAATETSDRVYPVAVDKSGYLAVNVPWTDSKPVTSVAGKTGAVTLAKGDVGLGNVDNKSSATIRSEITSSNVTTALGFTPLNASLKGANSGIAELDSNGKVPSSQLPSYVDDVLEYIAKTGFPSTGETGKIYVDTATNKTYRWSGSDYVEISASLALGTTSSTAYRGDYGNAAYAHAVTNKGSAFSSGLYKITTNSEGHVTAATAVAKSDITGLGIPGSDTTYTFDGTYNASTNKAATVSTVTNAIAALDGNLNDTTPGAGKTLTAFSETDGKVSATFGNISITKSQISDLGTIGAAAAKGVDTSIAASSTSTNLPTSQAVAAFVEGKGYKTTDNNTTYSLTQDSSDGHKITLTPSSGTAQTITIPDNNTDTKVTSAANHYTPSRDTSADKSASASGATAAWSIDVVKGVTVQTDGKGHVTGVAVTSGKIPSNPNTDTHRPVQVNGTQILGNDTTALNLKAGSNVSITNSSGTVTIAATDTTYSSKAAASGGTDVSLVTTGEKATWNAKTSNVGTITGITMNGASKGTSGIVDLGTVITSHQDISEKAPLASPALTGTPTAPTAATTTENTQIATTAYVKNKIDSVLAANDAMIFKGTIGSSGATVTALPNTHNAGWTYKVITAATYAGKVCEVGDLIICITDGTAANNDHWTVVQTNVDGAVTGPTSSTGDHIATFNGTSGKVIKDSGYTIAKSVPSNAVFTDTDTKVTAVGNHYTPAEDTSAKLSADASSSTAATWNSTSLVTGVDIKRDAKGHVVGVAVDSIKMPANPNSDTHRAIQVNGTQALGSNTTALNLKAGSNVTITDGGSGAITIAATDTNTWRGIQDNLTSTSTTDSLSANQGKVLKGLVDGKAASSHTHNYAGSASAGGPASLLAGTYSGSGGQLAPSAVSGGQVKAAMMNNPKGLSGFPTYADTLLMDTYTGTDVPWTTGLGIIKQDASPRMFIFNGAKGNTTTWKNITEVVTTGNFTSQSLTKSQVTTALGYTPPTTNTTYTAATAAPGDIATSGSTGSSTNYARQDHTHGISLATGDSNGQVKIAGSNVSVKGLGSAAFTNSSAYATSSHTHTTSIATSTGTNQITLAANTKYAITAGDTSYIFTTPSDTNTWRPVSDSVSSTSSSDAASSKAVKTAYDLAASKTANTGTVTSVAAGTGLSGGTITTSGTLSVSYGTTAGTACQGNDSRLSDSRNAKDVYSWAKASTKPSYTYSEVGAMQAPLFINTNNASASDALTYGTATTLSTGQLVFVTLAKAMVGSENATLKFGSNTAIYIYLTGTTRLKAKYAAGTMLGLVYYANNLYMINPPAAV